MKIIYRYNVGGRRPDMKKTNKSLHIVALAATVLLCGCSASFYKSPAAGGVVVTEVQDAGQTEASEEVSTEQITEAVTQPAVAETTAKNNEAAVPAALLPTGFPEGQIQRPFLMYEGKQYIYDPNGGIVSEGLPEDAICLGKITLVTYLPENELEMSCVGEGTEIYYSATTEELCFTMDKINVRRLKEASEQEIIDFGITKAEVEAKTTEVK